MQPKRQKQINKQTKNSPYLTCMSHAWLWAPFPQSFSVDFHQLYLVWLSKLPSICPSLVIYLPPLLPLMLQPKGGICPVLENLMDLPNCDCLFRFPLLHPSPNLTHSSRLTSDTCLLRSLLWSPGHKRWFLRTPTALWNANNYSAFYHDDDYFFVWQCQ